MANAGYGYWQNILTYKFEEYFSQILIGSNGKTAVKYYTIEGGQVSGNSGWRHLVDEFELEWKTKSLQKAFPAAGVSMVIDIPEIDTVKEIYLTVGITGAFYTYRKCPLFAVGQRCGFEYISASVNGYYFTGYVTKDSSTQVGAFLENVSGWEASRIEIIDVMYR